MPLPPEFVRYQEGNSWQVLTGAAKRLNDYSLEERLPVTTANELVRLTLLPTIAEIHPSKRGIHFINRLKYVVGQWQRVHKPEERENSLMWELASYPYVDPKVESNIITLLAHTSLVEELFANLWVALSNRTYWSGF